MKLSYLFAEVMRRPVRSLGAVLSVAVGLALFVSLQAYAGGYRAAARAPLAEIGADVTAQRQGQVPEQFAGMIFPHSVAPLHRDEIARIAALPGVQSVAEAIFFWSFDPPPQGFVAGLGFDPAVAFGPGRLRNTLTAGRFLQPGDRAVALVDASYAAQAHLAPGSTLTFSDHAFTVVGVVDSARAGQIASANLYITLTDAQALAVAAPNVLAVHDIRPDDANILFLKVEQTQSEAVAASAKAILGQDAIVSSAQSFSTQLGALFNLIDRFGTLVGLASLLIAVALLVRTTAAGLWERRREIALMRAVGWRRRDIVQQLLGETLVLVLAGAVVGLALAGVAALVMSQSQVTVPVPWELSPMPHFLPGGAKPIVVVVPLQATITPALAGLALVLALATTLPIALWLPGRIAGIKPAEVLRSE
jgi:lipoprotein-releasing system permease protein